ncbi:response regulator [Anaerolineales bacterium HSG25]|nr:response regulator [Anaerolineales bacterium HSG25]
MLCQSTILVVDDETVAHKILNGLLVNEGYHLIFAHSGQEALTKASLILPDLVLLDVMMPGMDGFAVCRALRNDSVLAEVPIVMITSLDDRRSRLKGIEAGADDFINKPVDKVELRLRVKSITRLNRYRQLHTERANLKKAHQELAQAYDETLSGWAHALELRDKETEGHSQRVMLLTVKLARYMGVNAHRLVHIRRGALLHDIGKMAIPDHILLKTGDLTDDERLTMCQHPIYAYEMLSKITYLQPALDIPYCHHEWWNGNGYPRGLRGEEIPIAARIFAVIDVWDALNSDRPYRSAWSTEDILVHIQQLSGTHFDPKVVTAFIELMNSTE